jgi:hypothetical protein
VAFTGTATPEMLLFVEVSYGSLPFHVSLD